MVAQKLPIRPRQKWLLALGNTADGVFLTDAGQHIMFWNRGAQRILGYSQAEVSNRHCFEVLLGKCCGKPFCHAGCKVQSSVQRGILPDNIDLLARTKKGKEVWVNVSTVVLPGRRDPLIGHLFRDVTHQKRNEEAIQNIRNTLGVPDFPKSNSEGEKGTVRNFLCKENGLSTLTRREIEVLVLLAEGLSTIAIAERIGVSPFTTRNHIRNTLKKLGLHSKSQAISFAFTNGLF